MNNFIEMYLDWLNNYLSIEVFAEHKKISVELACLIIKEGRILHEINTVGIDGLTTPSRNYFVDKMGH